MASFESASQIVPGLAVKDNHSDTYNTNNDNNSNTATREPIVATIDNGPVQAYAKLEGDEFCYYIRTLQVSLGRKVTNPDNVDVPLGNTKSVSRHHARLFYNFSHEQFELTVFGKNGAFVNEQFIERGITVPLENKMKIQIGEMAFVFLLPRSNADEVNANSKASNRNEDFGYISTPHQLEKHALVQIQKELEKNKDDNEEEEELMMEVDDNDEDNQSESSEPNPYSNKDTKPPYSYASLIAQAINSIKSKKMTLNGIYNYITTRYPYYQMTQNGWQNSIRHNLSLNKAFVKVPRAEFEPGKGAFWAIDSNAETQFTNGIYKRNKKNLSPTQLARKQYHDSESTTAVKKKHKKEHYTETTASGLDQNEGETAIAGSPKILNVNIKTEENSHLSPTRSNRQIPYEMPLKIKENDMTESTTVPQDCTVMPVSMMTHHNKVRSSSTEPPLVNIQTSPTILATTTLKASKTAATEAQQVQLQAQLQNTIRQHLLDPVKYPLPTSIAQLLPNAIAQLPPQLATQLSCTLSTSLKSKGDEEEEKKKKAAIAE